MLDLVLRSFAQDLAKCRLFRPDGQLPKLGRLARACARAQESAGPTALLARGLPEIEGPAFGKSYSAPMATRPAIAPIGHLDWPLNLGGPRLYQFSVSLGIPGAPNR